MTSKAIEKQTRTIGLKGAIALTLGSLASGVLVGYSLDKNKDEEEFKKSALVASSEPEPEADDSDWPENLVDENEFDKDPLRYVNVDQCRDLIFQVTGKRCLLEDDEILEKARQIQEEVGANVGENLIDQFCVSSQRDREAIRRLTKAGFTVFKKLGQKGYSWMLELAKPDGSGSDVLWLEQQPPCRPPLSEEEKNLETIRKEDLQRQRVLNEGGFQEELGKIDINNLRQEGKQLGIEDELNGLFEEIESLKTLDADSTQQEKLTAACRFLFFHYKSLGTGQISSETAKKIEDSPILDGNIEKIGDLAGELGEANGLTDADDCLLHISGLTSK